MPTRPFWKGYLKLSLVTCPVAMTPATTENAKVRLHVLNRKTGNRVVSRYVDAGDGAPVDEDKLVKGYAKAEDEFVLMEDDELDSVALESTRTIDIERFVPAASVDPIWLDRAHYLTPDDPVAEEAFAVIRDAMKAAAMAGLSRLVLYRRERPVMLKPLDKEIVVWTLRYNDEVRDDKDVFGAIDAVKSDPQALALVEQLIEQKSTLVECRPCARSNAGKIAGDADGETQGGRASLQKAASRDPAKTGKVINMMDALRQSLRSEARPPKSR